MEEKYKLKQISFGIIHYQNLEYWDYIRKKNLQQNIYKERTYFQLINLSIYITLESFSHQR